MIPWVDRRGQSGFTLVELMVSLVLGLLVVMAVASLMLSNRRVYGANESVNRIQENQRAAFELLARDIREAGSTPCGRRKPAIRSWQATSTNSGWWASYVQNVIGWNSTSEANTGGATGSDAISLFLTNGTQYNVVAHQKSNDPVTLSQTPDPSLVGKDVLICNNSVANVFRVTSISGKSLQHAGSASASDGNCSNDNPSSFVVEESSCNDASALSATRYCFWGSTTLPTAAQITAGNCQVNGSGSPAFVVVPYEAKWTVESNGRGGTSLYRTRQGGNYGDKEEIAEGVTSLKMRYKVGTAANYVASASVGDWSQVTAVNVSMTFQATQGAMTWGDVQGTDNLTMTRTLEDYIVIRNHQTDIQ
jgi:type IV pilus assembly protein PilW